MSNSSFTSALLSEILFAVGQSPKTDPALAQKLREAAKDSGQLTTEWDRSAGKAQPHNTAEQLLNSELSDENIAAREHEQAASFTAQDKTYTAKQQASLRHMNFLRLMQVPGMSSATASELANRYALAGVTVTPDTRKLPEHSGLEGKGRSTVLGWTDLLARTEDNQLWKRYAQESLYAPPQHPDGWTGLAGSKSMLGSALTYAKGVEGHRTDALMGFMHGYKSPTRVPNQVDAGQFARLIGDEYVRALDDDDVPDFVKSLRDLADATESGAIEDHAAWAGLKAKIKYQVAEQAGSKAHTKVLTGAPGAVEDAYAQAHTWDLLMAEGKARAKNQTESAAFAKWLRDTANNAEHNYDDAVGNIVPREAEEAAWEEERVVVPKNVEGIVKRLYEDRRWEEGRTAKQLYDEAKTRLAGMRAMLGRMRKDKTQSFSEAEIQQYDTQAHEYAIWISQSYPRIKRENIALIEAAQAAAQAGNGADMVTLGHPVTGDAIEVPAVEVFTQQVPTVPSGKRPIAPAPAPPAAPADPAPPAANPIGAAATNLFPPTSTDRAKALADTYVQDTSSAVYKGELERLRRTVYGMLAAAQTDAALSSSYAKNLAAAAKAESEYLRKQGLYHDPTLEEIERAADIILPLLGVDQAKINTVGQMTGSLGQQDFAVLAKENRAQEIANVLPTERQMNAAMRNLLSSGIFANDPDPTGDGSVNATQLLAVYNNFVKPIEWMKRGQKASESGEVVGGEQAATGETIPSGFRDIEFANVVRKPVTIGGVKYDQYVDLKPGDCVRCKVGVVADGDTYGVWIPTIMGGRRGRARFPVRIDVNTADLESSNQPFKDNTLHDAATEFVIDQFNRASDLLMVVTPLPGRQGIHDDSALRRYVGTIHYELDDHWYNISDELLKAKAPNKDGVMKPLAERTFYGGKQYPRIPNPGNSILLRLLGGPGPNPSLGPLWVPFEDGEVPKDEHLKVVFEWN